MTWHYSRNKAVYFALQITKKTTVDDFDGMPLRDVRITHHRLHVTLQFSYQRSEGGGWIDKDIEPMYGSWLLRQDENHHDFFTLPNDIFESLHEDVMLRPQTLVSRRVSAHEIVHRWLVDRKLSSKSCRIKPHLIDKLLDALKPKLRSDE